LLRAADLNRRTGRRDGNSSDRRRLVVHSRSPAAASSQVERVDQQSQQQDENDYLENSLGLRLRSLTARAVLCYRWLLHMASTLRPVLEDAVVIEFAVHRRELLSRICQNAHVIRSLHNGRLSRQAPWVSEKDGFV
jgi:hypothetical protein